MTTNQHITKVQTGEWDGQPIWREVTPEERAIRNADNGVDYKKTRKDMDNATKLLGGFINKIF